jgi:hypothetical protein
LIGPHGAAPRPTEVAARHIVDGALTKHAPRLAQSV